MDAVIRSEVSTYPGRVPVLLLLPAAAHAGGAAAAAESLGALLRGAQR